MEKEEIKKMLQNHITYCMTQSKPYPIVCVQDYETGDGKVIKKGTVSYKSWGHNMPDYFKEATAEDLMNYRDK